MPSPLLQASRHVFLEPLQEEREKIEVTAKRIRNDFEFMHVPHDKIESHYGRLRRLEVPRDTLLPVRLPGLLKKSVVLKY